MSNLKVNPPNDFRVEIEKQADGIRLSVYLENHSPVDRGDEWLSSWGLGLNDSKLANRLRRAILAGVILENVRVERDVNDRTYYTADSTILSRTMNAELKRKGF